MMNFPKRFLATVKRAVSVFAIALATSGATNAPAALLAAPASAVSMAQAPKKSALAGSVRFATKTDPSDGPTIG